jgi:ribosomal protein L4
MDRKIKIPKGEASLAKAMLLSKIVAMKKLFVIQKAQFNSLKTSNAKKVLAKFDAGKVIIVNDGGVDVNSLLAVRNLQNAKFVSNDMLTARDLFYADAVLIDMSSVNNFAKVLSVENNES